MWKEHLTKLAVGAVSAIVGFALGRRSGKKSSSERK